MCLYCAIDHQKSTGGKVSPEQLAQAGVEIPRSFVCYGCNRSTTERPGAILHAQVRDNTTGEIIIRCKPVWVCIPCIAFGPPIEVAKTLWGQH